MIEKNIASTVKELCDSNLESDAIQLIQNTIFEFADAEYYTGIDELIKSIELGDFKSNPLVVLSVLNNTVALKSFLNERESYLEKSKILLDELFGQSVQQSLMSNL